MLVYHTVWKICISSIFELSDLAICKLALVHFHKYNVLKCTNTPGMFRLRPFSEKNSYINFQIASKANFSISA